MISDSQSSLTELLSLRNFGRKVARTEPPAFLLRWSDDGRTICCGEMFSVTMDDFPKLAGHFVSRTEVLSERLMLAMKLDVDLSRVKDDLTNSGCGY